MQQRSLSAYGYGVAIVALSCAFACTNVNSSAFVSDTAVDGTSDLLDVPDAEVVDPACTTCHGSPTTSAPPLDLRGKDDPASRGVGAHQAHLAGNTVGRDIPCSACHAVPASVDAAGHMDSAWPAEVVFSGLAQTGDLTPETHATGLVDAPLTCSSVYCHGATLAGGQVPTPRWNPPDEAGARCDACHGSPPPAPHPAYTACSACHGPVVADDGTIADRQRHVDGTVDLAWPATCGACHGSAESPAPPPDLGGSTSPESAGVGAHGAHLFAKHDLSAPIACATCHLVPATVNAPGHVDDGETGAEVLFNGLAVIDNVTPSYVPASATCAGTYCHGSTLSGGRVPYPVWTDVTGQARGCDACHGAPPPAPHVQEANCGLCHPATASGMAIVHPEKHIDGHLDVTGTQACSGCHGSLDNPAPPVDTHGDSATTLVTVGAHQAHLRASSGLSAPVACTECHVEPSTVDAAGHLGAAPAELTFGALATADGAEPTWSTADATCSGTYCHGATLSGGALASPTWTRVDDTQDACGSCHGVPPPAPHAQVENCGLCHPATAQGGAIAHPEKHVDGVLQVSTSDACTACHGSNDNPAPPIDTAGGSATTLVTVGAHQAHLQALSGLSSPVTCIECHVEPATVDDEGHLDASPAEVTFGALAATGGASPAWDHETATCSTTYCHGATLVGGDATAPVWTAVDGSQDTCGSCHGFPPPEPHVQALDCGLCHAETAEGSTIAHAHHHVDGVLDVDTDQTCSSCHGSADNPAPPVDTHGGSATTLATIGAHQPHLKALSSLAAPVACAECHAVPATIGAAGHLDAAPAEVTFGALASLGTTAPAWNAASTTCSSTYCHGATLEGGTSKTPVWTTVDGSQDTCGSCHGFPPPAPHVLETDCGQCHAPTAEGSAVVSPGHHVDGKLDVSADLSCTACHGSADNPAPPIDTNGESATSVVTVGAHQAHLQAASGLSRPVACAECHRVPTSLSDAMHLDAAPAELTFGALASTQGATPAWNRADATCSSTYCHGATLSGGTTTAPEWTTVDGSQDTCGSCHGYPPPLPHTQSTACGSCHPATAQGGAIAHPEHHVDGVLDVVSGQTCSSCHGSADNPAPPVDTAGGDATTLVTVGAHQSHLQATAQISAPVACAECHLVPASADDAGHLDAAPAELTFGPLATTGDLGPVWVRADATCSTTYCHGATLSGGDVPSPTWTVVDGSQAACGSCHGDPPPAPHSQSTECGLCHPATASGHAIATPERHVDGVLDVLQGQDCAACHGSVENPAPPLDTTGGAQTTLVTVGAHQPHVKATSGLAAPLGCGECHVVPASVEAPGHIETAPAEVHFGARAGTDGASPNWDRDGATCSSTYCHGATLSGGVLTSPAWTRVDGTQDACGSCHGVPPPAPHVAGTQCGLCHGATAAGTTIVHPEKHIDGVLDVTGGQTCSTCHGSADNAAPPLDTTGGTATALRTVGAHQAHLEASSALSAPVACAECHVVPAGIGEATHVDPAPAEVAFGPLASASGAAPEWIRGSSTCSSTYCHGATLEGGANRTPTWTTVDGTQDACGSCHGVPPPAPHVQSPECGLCHGATAEGATVAHPASHVNGVVDVDPVQSCSACHGSAQSPAPPVDTTGGVEPTLVTVGAHQAHLQASSNLAAPVPCGSCHVQPAGLADPGHIDAAPAEVTFSGIARAGGAVPSWDRGQAACSSTYCHGATLEGGSVTAPDWTVVDDSQDACGACHGVPPPAPHAQIADCGMCHAATATGGTVTHPEHHVDGVLDVTTGQACNACHGGAANAAPPVDTAGGSAVTLVTVGAHQSHLAVPSGLSAAVACAECHVVPATRGAAGHIDASPAEVAFGNLARTDGAEPSWDRTATTCSATYCHGATLGGGALTVPSWTTVDGSQATCGACHGLPPPAPHVQVSNCGQCHGATAEGSAIVHPEHHVDGQVDVDTAQACNACHGSATNDAPPVDTTGASATSLVTIGAHRAHLTASKKLAAPVACEQCHVRPASLMSAGHVDGAPAEVTFGGLARADGASPSWDRADAVCSSTYCHGATLAGGSTPSPIWTRVDGTQSACDSCHGFPPSAPHVQVTDCGSCHAATATGQLVTHPERHVDGKVDTALPNDCSTCHGSADNAAPPLDSAGGALTTLTTVGAHQAHLQAQSGLSAPVACGECHVEPATSGAEGHLDAPPAEVAFGGLAAADGASPAWRRTDATCASTYCHGATLTGGAATTPVWTKVDGTQDACGSCHGFPPPAPHAQNANCGACHPATAAGGTVAHPDQHIDGTLDVVTHPACDACHGSASSAAPPVDTAGASATTLVTIGAHQAHLKASSGLSTPVACTECHLEPASVDDAGHLDAAPAEVVFGALASKSMATPVWDRATGTCSSTYCHGATLEGGAAVTPVWTRVDGTQDACGACHGFPPPAPHVSLTDCGRCHASASGGAIVHPERHIDGVLETTLPAACNSCHGGADNAAPPLDTAGGAATTLRAVGAHQAHVRASSGLASPLACTECHVLPATPGEAGHLDAAPAEVSFGALARKSSSLPVWNGTAGTCSSTYCHGATLTGGSATAPLWTRVDGTQDACGSCHGFPPPLPHVQSATCGLCHSATTTGGAVTHPERHVDGVLDVDNDQACDACHGNPDNAAPPVDLAGGSATTLLTVGAHQAHLTASSALSAPVTCDACHVVPSATTTPGHVDNAPAEIVFGDLARVDGAVPEWDRTAATCSSTYCHGATLTGGTLVTPVWTMVDDSQDACGACHGVPPAAPHVQVSDCGMCHSATATGANVTNAATHVDGVLQIDQAQTCNSCHGSATNDAPPVDTQGGSLTTLVTVGAHQAHLRASSGLAAPVACSECHVTPTNLLAAGHVDPAPAEVVFGALARTSGLAPAWNATGATCSSTYCHGATLQGGSATAPLWTRVDGTQDTCTSCHGFPPPAPHTAMTNCGLCHAATATGGAVTTPSKHIDGLVQTSLPASCSACHGSGLNAAPPVDTTGGSATTLKTVGAHQAHVRALSNLADPVACAQCHVTPATTGASGHLDGPPAEVRFGALAAVDGATPTWSPANATCSSTYCHGATLAGGASKTPLWTKVDGTQDACGACHGFPPPAPHVQSPACGACHAATATGSEVTHPSHHVDGQLDLDPNPACNACHGSAANEAPPVDTTGATASTLKTVGAHQAHVAATSGHAAPMACAECHVTPATAVAAGHIDGSPAEVTFGGLAASDGTTPAWNPAQATCSSTYCHGATLSGGSHKAPVWTLVDGSQAGCDACHGNPPPAPHVQLAGCGTCHPATATGGAISTPQNHVDGTLQTTLPGACNTCHGSATSFAPPVDTTGGTATTLVTVGAHQPHVKASSGLAAPMACAECHVQPSSPGAIGHLDAAPAEVTFGTLARTSNSAPTWNRADRTCSNTYCHGATLGGGSTPTPLWTRVDATQDACGSCHGVPPPAPHVQSPDCGQCHVATATGGVVSTPANHVNGIVEVVVGQACNTCHGSADDAAPPLDTHGGSATTLTTVGAHQAHLKALSGLSLPLACADCHVTPGDMMDAGHIDAAPAELAFGTLARVDGAAPAWVRATGTCSSTYCHGATLSGGTRLAPVWTLVDGTQDACGACHGVPPPAPHVQVSTCGMCHSATALGSEIETPARHVDGVLDVDAIQACNACHGNVDNAAPPVDTTGGSLTTLRTVGAHQEHVTARSALSKPLTCDQCHVVPSGIGDAGHIEASPAEVVFGPLARLDGSTPAWSASAATCSSTYCHGASLGGGQKKTPVWTRVDGTQDTCTSCHGFPPPAPHAALTDCGLCHAASAQGGAITTPANHVDGVVQVSLPGSCSACHGGTENAAPPVDTQGGTATTRTTVGAHQSHVRASDGLAAPVACAQCHVMPADTAAAGHLGAPPAEVAFGSVATADGATPTWTRGTGACSSTYCHGSTLNAGGTKTTPVWTQVDGSQAACGACHGVPPPAPHVQVTNCGLCHRATAVGSTIAVPGKHVNGVLDVDDAQSCNACHGSAANTAPPVDTTGGTSTTRRTVGAHQPHLLASSGLAAPVACTECHVVPASQMATGHVDPSPAEVTFGDLAAADGATPAWNPATATCSSTYCHGASLPGGSNTTPVWTRVDGTEDTCGSCHGVPPPAPHVQLGNCGLCHPDTATGAAIAHPDKHIDGAVEARLPTSCSACHGSATNAAPPQDTLGRSAVTITTVGAHQAHLQAPSALASPVACGECHKVPTTTGEAGHLDATPAELTWGALAGADGATPAWDRTTGRCSSTYCHGGTLSAGTNTAPIWTAVDGTQDACGTCHGLPPAAPHVQLATCGACHSATATDTAITTPANHVNGVVDVDALNACNACHGSATSDAPPEDTTGGTATTLVTVGAHQAHLKASSNLASPVACDTCHSVPAETTTAGHLDAAPAEVLFGGLATAHGVAPSWNRTTATCATTYCHGATLNGGSLAAPVWTTVDGTQDTCGTCHGVPPADPHPQNPSCGTCHPDTATGSTLTNPTNHVNGVLNVTSDLACNACHGSVDNPAPPLDTTGGSVTTLVTVGAHQPHLRASSGLSSTVACTECHLVPATVGDASHLGASPAEVSFGALAAADGAAPAWDRTSATCSSTYCHGGTLGGGTHAVPLWTRVDGTDDTCGSCHGLPPPAPHVQLTNCGLCHGLTATGQAIAHAGNHIDGAVQTQLPATCNACHGSATSEAPPKDTTGGSATTLTTVGAHQAHLTAESALAAPVACTQCHVRPATASAAGHLDASPAEVTFGPLASSGTTPAWTRGNATCSATYCHGATLAGGTRTAPVWTQVDHTQDTCSSCHGYPPPAPHVQNVQCGLCHPATATGGAVTHPEHHVDGVLDTAVPATCNACHGSATNEAPPVDTTGRSQVTLVTVGAHQTHVKGSTGLSSALACTECHVKPAGVLAAGHLDASPAEVTFGALSRSDGASPAWSHAAETCSTTYCHGSTLAGGVLTTPTWTKVDGTQNACGSCHGVPPPAPHVQLTNCGLCHGTTATGSTVAHSEKHVNGVLDVAYPAACNACHGSAANAAPPVDTTGGSAVTLTTVGAHQAHVTAQAGLASPLACGECHVTPATASASGHLDPSPAEVTFGALSKVDGAVPAWNRTTGTCATTYCHGATLAGGTAKNPLWTKVDGTQETCSSCHGFPPPAPHVQVSNCGLCHSATAVGGTIASPAHHVDGVLDESTPTACNACHGGDLNAAPPSDTTGGTLTTLVTVGAHQAHVDATLAAPFACDECHLTPAAVLDAGHIDASPAELAFGTLARADGATAAWSRTTATCTTYCHGATLGGGTAKTPLWTRVDGTQSTCTSCHGSPPPAPHVPASSTQCRLCHADTMNATGGIKTPAKHVNGVLDVTPYAQMTCHTCHGSLSSDAPPIDTTGGTATTLKTVGAHQPHLQATAALSAKVSCGECHVVPASVAAAGHVDPNPAELTFGTLARADGAAPTWNATAATCASTYCHGATLAGGTAKTPLWTKVDGTQETCSSCHGNPPPAPHSPITTCGVCHLATMNLNGTFKDATRHIDGTLDVPATCNGCHGNAAGSATTAADQAPPVDLSDNSATTSKGVGAHQPHLRGSSNISAAISCAQCHLVPAGTEVAGHVDTAMPAEVTFGTLARTGTLTPVWSSTASTCTSTYCHGTTLTLAGGSNKVPSWVTVNNTQDACGTCHASAVTGMTRPHPVGAAGSTCATCHGTTMTDNSTFRDKTKHVNGTVEIAPASGSFTCNGTCHGTTTAGVPSPANQAPPNDTQGLSATSNKSVGDHRNHLTQQAANPLAAAMPCNECHAVPTAVPDATVTTHLNKAVNVTFTIGTRSKKVSGGTYTASTATCTTIYCHGAWTSSGRTQTSWSWTTTTVIPGTGCTTVCHGLPPATREHRGPTGGPGPSEHNVACGRCHATVAATTTPNAITSAGAANHINGNPDVSLSGGGTWNATTRSCDPTCHGAESWGARVLP